MTNDSIQFKQEKLNILNSFRN